MKLEPFEIELERNVYEGREHVTVTGKLGADNSFPWELVSFYVDDVRRLVLTRHESVGTPDEFLTDELGRMEPDA